MGRLRVLLVFAVLVCAFPAQAGAATTIPDVSTSFWARTQIVWATNHHWVPLRSNGTFAPKNNASRAAAARVLASLNAQQTGTPVADVPYQQAVDAGWIGAGTGSTDTISQLAFDRGILRVRLGIGRTRPGWPRSRPPTGRRPQLPKGFGIEQVVRQLGARWNVPFGADSWETWPGLDPAPRKPGRAGLPARPPVELLAVLGRRPAERGARTAQVSAAEEGRARLRDPLGGRPLHLGRHLRPAADAVRARRPRAASTAQASCGG